MPTIKILKTYSVKQLKDEASKQKLKGRAGLGKSDLIKLMMKSKSKFHHLTGDTKVTKPIPKPRPKPKETPEQIKEGARLYRLANPLPNFKGRFTGAADKAALDLARDRKKHADALGVPINLGHPRELIPSSSSTPTANRGQSRPEHIITYTIPELFRKRWNGFGDGWVSGEVAEPIMSLFTDINVRNAHAWWSDAASQIYDGRVVRGLSLRQAGRSRDIYLREHYRRGGNPVPNLG